MDAVSYHLVYLALVSQCSCIAGYEHVRRRTCTRHTPSSTSNTATRGLRWASGHEPKRTRYLEYVYHTISRALHPTEHTLCGQTHLCTKASNVFQAPLTSQDRFRELSVKVHVRRPEKDTWAYIGRGVVTQEAFGQGSRIGPFTFAVIYV